MSELTPKRLTELRRIAEAATPGPWQWAGSRDKGDPHAYVYAGDYAIEGEPDLWCEIVSECPEADAQHIATFDPTTCLALLDRIEALQSMLLHLYKDTVVPGTGYCIRCGMIGGHDEWCAMAAVEELLGIAVKGDGEAEGGASDA